MVIYHTDRTVYWGNWGICFMNPQPDSTKNFGDIVGMLYFPVGARGPNDLSRRKYYTEACRAWIDSGIAPVELTREKAA